MKLMNRVKRNFKEMGKQFVGKFYNLPRSHMEIISDFIFGDAVEGDYLEFGVFKGDSFIHAYHVLKRAEKKWNSNSRNASAFTNKERMDKSRVVNKADMRYFAFDSFDGLPEPVGIDKDNSRFTRGRYDCSEKQFLLNLRQNDVDIQKVITIPGWYNQSLNGDVKRRHNLKAASIVMIDCDLYESTRYVLDFITDLVVDGTVLLFDDWFNFKGHPDRGERKAAREWLEKNPHISLTDYHVWDYKQKSFIVNL